MEPVKKPVRPPFFWLTVHLKPYWGKPAVRNFRGGGGSPKLDRARRAPLPYSALILAASPFLLYRPFLSLSALPLPRLPLRDPRHCRAHLDDSRAMLYCPASLPPMLESGPMLDCAISREIRMGIIKSIVKSTPPIKKLLAQRDRFKAERDQ